LQESAEIMRTVLVSLTAVICLGLNSFGFVRSAQAERKMFIIASDADGYGVDRCLATGDRCGAAAANSYCKSHEFAEAASYNKVDRDDITGAIPNGGASVCKGSRCDDFVAIVCNR
jgi:hypothetical protein